MKNLLLLRDGGIMVLASDGTQAPDSLPWCSLTCYQNADVRRGVGYFKIKPEELRKKRNGYRDQRALVMEMMYRYGGMGQREVRKYMGDVGYTTVSHERLKIRDKTEQDSRVKRWSKETQSLLIPNPKI